MNLAPLNLGGLEVILVVVFSIIMSLLPLYCLFDIYHKQFNNRNHLLINLVIVWLLPVIGSLIYIFFVRNYLEERETRNWS